MGKRPTTRNFGVEELKSLHSYDPITGLFTRKTDRGGYKAGGISGCINPDGYILIVINAAQYRAHHLAWLYMTGEWPPEDMDVDHEDRNRSNNVWKNLRLATRTQNNMNGGIRSDNKSGVRGVGFIKATGKWYARIKSDGEMMHLGHFVNKGDAIAARQAAEIRIFGEYSPT